MNLWHLLRYGTFAHDLHRGRNAEGKAVEVCALCGYARVVLAEPVIVGPAHQQVPDIGAVRTQAQYPDRKVNVVGWRRNDR